MAYWLTPLALWPSGTAIIFSYWLTAVSVPSGDTPHYLLLGDTYVPRSVREELLILFSYWLTPLYVSPSGQDSSFSSPIGYQLCLLMLLLLFLKLCFAAQNHYTQCSYWFYCCQCSSLQSLHIRKPLPLCDLWSVCAPLSSCWIWMSGWVHATANMNIWQCNNFYIL